MQKTIILSKKWVSLSILLMMLCGCATAIPLSMQKDNSDYRHWMEFFERSKGLSADEIPGQYNYSRLREGSKVKIRITHNNSTGSDFITKFLREIRINDNRKLYVIEHNISGKSTFTSQLEPLSLSKIICPRDPIFPDKSDYSNIKEMEWLAQRLKDTKIESKIVDFKLISDEQLIVAHQRIVCKVYQVHTITRHVMPSTKMMPGMSSILDENEKIWISDDVPFGFVKSQSIQTLHMYSDPNSRFPIMADPAPQEMLTEVAEFNY